MNATPPHMLLLTGVGGMPAQEALAAARRVTPRVSVVHVTAWGDGAALRRTWAGADPDSRPADAADRPGTRFVTAADLDAAQAAALKVHEHEPVDGIVTFSELLLRPQARIAAELALPGNSPEAIRVAQSKALQREAFAQHGVPSPRFAVVRSEDDLDQALHRVGLPAVLKPSLGAGSRGVGLVHTATQARAALRRELAAPTPFIQEDGAYLLEEPMPVAGQGDSPFADYVSVESLLHDGEPQHLAVTDRLRLRHGYVEEGLVLPSRLDGEIREAVLDCADRAWRAVGLRQGALHTEIALTPSGPRVIEVNARAGGPLPTLLRVAAGYDFAVEIVRNALGLPAAASPQLTLVGWFRFVPIPPGDWTIVAQRAAQEVHDRFPDLVRLGLRFAPGQPTRRDTTQHLAAFTVRGSTIEQARRTAEAVEEFLGIRLEPLHQDRDVVQGRA